MPEVSVCLQGWQRDWLFILNSSLFDQYFRLFSGHTQVNATDLRKMRYPTREQLIRMGNHIDQWLPDQETLDAILDKECGPNG